MQRRRDDGELRGSDSGQPRRLPRRLAAILLAALAVAAAAGVAIWRLSPRTPELGACLRAESPPAPPATTPPVAPAGVPAGSQPAVVAHVVDGDGICVRPTGPGPLPEGRIAELRLIGVNAPGKGMCGSDRAASFARDRIGEGSAVWLEADQQDRDGYGRFLRYVWESTGGQSELFNVTAVRESYVRALPKPPNDRYEDQISEAEAEARRDGDGVWRCLPWRFLRWLPVRR